MTGRGGFFPPISESGSAPRRDDREFRQDNDNSRGRSFTNGHRPPEQPWRAIDLPGLEGLEVPARRWIVPEWLPVRVVTLNYADGGIGKTLLSLQLMMAAALQNQTWCGLPVEQCPSVGLFTEDDKDELHFRMDAIRQHYNATWDDLADMTPVDATGQDNFLAVFAADGSMVPTPRWTQLRECAFDTGSRLIVLDTAATLFAGSEIDRKQVTQFVTLLTSLAQEIDGAVLLNCHPSLSSLSSGDLRSGSGAWNNSCRSRWSLTRPVGEDGNADLESPIRLLTKRKANQSATGQTITLEWENNVFTVPCEIGTNGSRKDEAELAFLTALNARTEENMHTSANSRAANFGPKVLKTTPYANDFSIRELTEAMNNLLSRGRLIRSNYTHDYKTHEEIKAVRQVPPGSARSYVSD